MSASGTKRTSSRTRVCPLSDNSGQSRILARDGLSAFDQKRTFHRSDPKLPLRNQGGKPSSPVSTAAAAS